MKVISSSFIISFIICIFSSPTNTYSQPYANSWIDYEKAYFSMKVYENGIYHISYEQINDALSEAGISVSTIHPAWYQVYAKGQQIPIYVSSATGQTSLQQGDYIEFYAEKNDGWLDQVFYSSEETQPNPYYSLITDTAQVYLTWDASTSATKLRMQVIRDDNFQSFTPSPFFYATEQVIFNQTYYAGNTANQLLNPAYESAEGWFDYAFTRGQSKTKQLPLSNIYTNAQASFQTAVIGASNYAYLEPDHHVRLSIGSNIIFDTLYEGYSFIPINFDVPASFLNNSSPALIFNSIDDLGNDENPDRNTIPFINFQYPHTTDMDNNSTFSMIIPNTAQAKTFLQMTNINIGASDTAWLYHFDNNSIKKIKVFPENGFFNVLVPNTGASKKCFLATEAAAKTTELKPINNSDAKFTNYGDNIYLNKNYFIFSNRVLREQAESYNTYRSINYESLLLEMEELYHQFSYGIRKHPLAISNYLKFANDHYNQKPSHVFLLGKAYNPVLTRKNSGYFENNLVPSYGYPPSDQLIGKGSSLDKDTSMYLSIGRLSAKDQEDVISYLNKVTQYESAQSTPEEWMKNILHFGGGTSSSEQQLFASYLRDYEAIAKDTLMGAFVSTFLKTSTNPIQINQAEQIKDLINNGVSMLTFFGHSSGSGFDQSIDDPANYDNEGKYPFLLANSCLAGDIFNQNYSFSEEFVLIENKGMIGFLASDFQALASSLNVFSESFYKNFCIFHYNESVGKSIQSTVRNILSDPQFINDRTMKITCYQMVLHGDPAIKINAQEKPDFFLDNTKIFTEPKNVTSEIDSFKVNIIHTNIGKAVSGDILTEIIHQYPDGSSEKHYRQIPATKFKDTLSLYLPVDLQKGIGLNSIKVNIDYLNQINEISEINNFAEKEIFIKSADVIPVFPANYAIYPSDNLTLKASTGYPFATANNYIFEIDTTDSFDSDFKKGQVIPNAQGIVSWDLPISLEPQKVYYWRVSIDTSNGHEANWRESSFQSIPETEGWGQSHFYQFKNNNYQYVSYNRPERHFEFVNSFQSVQIQTGYYPNTYIYDQWIKVNGSIIGYGSCLGNNNGLKFAVFDSTSFKPWISDPDSLVFGNQHCFPYPKESFDFYTTDSLNRAKVTNFINAIPDNNYVALFSHKSHNAEAYEEELLQAFESIGSAYIRSLDNNKPYILFGKKGSFPGEANERIGENNTSVISLEDSAKTKWNEGKIRSVIIGPSMEWQSIHWSFHNQEQNSSDSIYLNVYGIKANGTSELLKEHIPPDSLNLYQIERFIKASEYPFMQLEAVMRDDTLQTPPQMDYWRVIHKGVPEFALDPATHFVFYDDTLQEGDSIMFAVAIRNISTIDSDSLRVKYWITDKNQQNTTIPYSRQAPVNAESFFVDTIKATTRGLSGTNSFWVEVNPDFDQPEQFHFNNIGELLLHIKKDDRNPLLDVTFDGIHILDGDIISAKPLIEISLNDKNEFLLLDDTSNIKVFMQYPSEAEPRRIYFFEEGREKMIFYPATSSSNICKIDYPASFETDGTYTLIVQAKDASDNNSGAYDYQISFEIINKSTITEVMNWPNPFSTRTHFVFTLTGSEIPTYFKIQIMTITGRVVREIDMAELGPIHIGRNVTTYAWDGKDEYGDQLANGVYLYRVITHIKGKEIEKNATEASKYFKKDFGKMYLMR